MQGHIAIPLGLSVLCLLAVPSHGQARSPYDADIARGEALMKTGDTANAAALFIQSRKRQPGRWQAHWDLGLAFEAIGRRDMASASFKAACQRGKREACRRARDDSPVEGL